jgi:hypothetical protein
MAPTASRLVIVPAAARLPAPEILRHWRHSPADGSVTAQGEDVSALAA